MDVCFNEHGAAHVAFYEDERKDVKVFYENAKEMMRKAGLSNVFIESSKLNGLVATFVISENLSSIIAVDKAVSDLVHLVLDRLGAVK